MFRKALSISRLQILLLLRNKSTLIWMLIVPIVFTTLIGVAFGGFGSSGPAPKVPIAYVDLDQSDVSAVVGQALRSEGSLDVLALSETEARSRQKDEKVPVVVIVPKGFEERIAGGLTADVEIVRTAQRSSGYFLEQIIRNAAARVSSVAYAATVTTDHLAQWKELTGTQRTAVWMDAFRKATLSLADDPGITTVYTVLARTQPQVQLPDNATQSSSGFGAMFVMSSVLMTATVLVSERLRNTMARILTTPTTPMAFLGGKLLAMMSLGVMQFLLFILWGRFVMGVDWGRDPIAVGVMVIVYVFAATGLGVLVGAACRTMAQADVIATFVTYGTSMIAGSWWPIEVAPPYMQKMAQALPQYWAVNGLNKIVVRGLPLSSLGLNVAVLAGMGLLFLCAGTLIFARRARN